MSTFGIRESCICRSFIFVIPFKTNNNNNNNNNNKRYVV